ncbi:hypothetical protein GCM10009613_37440 [Pseudonocardia kongjuensis]|uniref:DUF3558 domain-containing protein n=1 Tax=Pseudonocardia kongjuensis TaxID=102227 RepID=A0ABN1XXL0_9PSEU
MARPVLILFVLVTVGALLAGCGSGEPESPFPERPAEIDVSTVDLCRALTAEEQAELGVEPGRARTGELSNGPTRICGWSNFDDGNGYGVQTIADGAVVAVGGEDTTVDVIDGYGVVLATVYGESAPLCNIYVDVSDAESIRVQVQATQGDAGGIPSFETVCGRARALTSKVLRNLAAVTP